MRRRRLIAAIAGAWLLAGLYGSWTYAHDYYRYRGFPAPMNPAGVAAGRLERVSFFSPAIGKRRSYDIYLPAGYARAERAGARFNVLYLLHGSPGVPRLFVDAGHLGVAMDTLVARRQVRPFLVVMPDGRDGSFKSDTEWADTAKGRYESFVLDVVRAVEQRYPTPRGRTHRAIAGNSEGAYGAINIALRHLDTFSVAQSWSGYFTQTRAGVYKHATPAVLRAASPAAYVGDLGSALKRSALHVFLYGGAKDPDTRALPGFAAALRSAGADVGSTIYPGRHDWGLWRSQTPHMLRLVSQKLAPA